MYRQMLYKRLIRGCEVLVYASLLTPFLYNTNWFQSFVSPKVFWFSLATELMLCLLLGALVLRGETFRCIVNPILFGLTIFGLAMSISAFSGVNAIHSFWGSFLRFQGVFFWWHCIVWTYVLVYLFRSSGRRVEMVLGVAVWVAALCAVYGIAEFLFGSLFFPDLSLPRASSFFGNPIYFANFLTVPMFLACYAFSKGFLDSRVVRFVVPIVLFLGVLVSVSRGALVGLVSGAIVAGLVWFCTRPPGGFFMRKRTFFVIVAISFIALLTFSRIPILNRIINFRDENVQSRMLLWKVAVRSMADRPWFGVGPENYEFSANKHFDSKLYTYNTIWNDKPHNQMLEIGVTMGMVGVLSYMGLLIVALWVVGRAYKSRILSGAQAGLLIGGMTAYFVQNLFAFDTPAALLMFCLLCAVIAETYPTGYKKVVTPLPQLTWVVFRGVGVAVASVGIICLIVKVYYPTAHALTVLGQEIILLPTSVNGAQQVIKTLLSQKFLMDRGFVALLYADIVLMRVTTATQESKEMLQMAINSLQKIAQREPNTLQYWLTLNDLYIRRAIIESVVPAAEAEGAVDHATILAPDRAEVWFARATLSSSRGSLTDARMAIEHALSLYPNYTPAIWLRIQLLVNAKDFSQAKTAAEMALAKQQWPSTVGELQWLFDLYEKEHMVNQALTLLDASIKQYQQNSEFLFNASQAYMRLGQVDRAQSVLYGLQENPGAISMDRINQALKTISK